MVVSSSSLIMALLWFTVAAYIGCRMLRRSEKPALAFLSAAVVLVALRAVLPLRYPGSTALRSKIDAVFAWRPFPGVTLGGCLLALWGIGAAVQLLRFLVKWIHQAWLLRRLSHGQPDSRLLDLCSGVCGELGYIGKWKLTVSEEIPTAYQTGFFHPYILLPANTAGFSEKDIRNIFRHEMQHFIGGDLWIKTGLQIVACLLWWNPVMSLLNRSIAQVLEYLCDKRVCANLSQMEQLNYLETLLYFFKRAAVVPANIVIERGKKMDKSKLLTLWWQVSLTVMVLMALILTIAECICNLCGILVPDILVIVCGTMDLFALFGFGFAMIKKVEERNEEMY